MNTSLCKEDIKALLDMYTTGYILDEEICSLFKITPLELDDYIYGRCTNGKDKVQERWEEAN